MLYFSFLNHSLKILIGDQSLFLKIIFFLLILNELPLLIRSIFSSVTLKLPLFLFFRYIEFVVTRLSIKEERFHAQA